MRSHPFSSARDPKAQGSSLQRYRSHDLCQGAIGVPRRRHQSAPREPLAPILALPTAVGNLTNPPCSGSFPIRLWDIRVLPSTCPSYTHRPDHTGDIVPCPGRPRNTTRLNSTASSGLQDTASESDFNGCSWLFGGSIVKIIVGFDPDLPDHGQPCVW